MKTRIYRVTSIGGAAVEAAIKAQAEPISRIANKTEATQQEI